MLWCHTNATYCVSVFGDKVQRFCDKPKWRPGGKKNDLLISLAIGKRAGHLTSSSVKQSFNKTKQGQSKRSPGSVASKSLPSYQTKKVGSNQDRKNSPQESAYFSRGSGGDRDCPSARSARARPPAWPCSTTSWRTENTARSCDRPRTAGSSCCWRTGVGGSSTAPLPRWPTRGEARHLLPPLCNTSGWAREARAHLPL